MNVVVLSCNHNHAGIELREKIAFASEGQLTDAYAHWRERNPGSELVLLSTCNRVEVYAAGGDDELELTAERLTDFVSEFHNLPSDQLTQAVLARQGPEAVQHLFDVVCSLDSMVLGEPQIVTQVKNAYRIAREHDSCGPLTNVLFQHALSVSARVRSETRLAEGRVSIASVAVGDFARSIFHRFDNKSVVVIGAGEMATETLRYLRDEGVQDITIVNRSHDKAKELAEQFSGRTSTYETLDELLMAADVVVSTTGATETLFDRERYAAIRAKSKRHSQFILDLGAPRDFAADVSKIDDNIFLFDIDSLQATCDRNRGLRQGEVRKAKKIIEQQTQRFMQEVYHRATGPVIQRLHEQLGEISRSELDLLYRKNSDFNDDQKAAIEKTVHRIVNKLLHPPLETLKDEAREGTPHGLVDAIKRLFNLSE
ncbi:UNVERIFIED_CONTAM: hypothetical protein GTU68_046245 [Idotea baltica]|nr:hypothetical protein [Idotea baltica]